MNSVLQAIASCQALPEWLQKNISDCRTNQWLAVALLRVWKGLIRHTVYHFVSRTYFSVKRHSLLTVLNNEVDESFNNDEYSPTCVIQALKQHRWHISPEEQVHVLVIK